MKESVPASTTTCVCSAVPEAIGELRVGRFHFRSRFHFRVGSRASSPNEVCGVGGLIGAQNVQYEFFCRL